MIEIEAVYSRQWETVWSSSIEPTWTQIEKQSKPILFGSYYRPSSTHLESLEDFDASLSKLGSSLDRNNVTIGGHFNAPDMNLNEEIPPFLLHLRDNHDLQQDVNKPTRRTETSNNILDVVFSSISSVIGDVKVVPGISDHDIVFFTVNLSCHRKKIAKRKIYISDAAMTKPRPNWLIMDGLPLLLVHLWFIRGGKDSSVSQSAIP